MIEVKFYYFDKAGIPQFAWKKFYSVEKAIRFMYKCKSSKNLIYAGEFACDDPNDTEYINLRFK